MTLEDGTDKCSEKSVVLVLVFVINANRGESISATFSWTRYEIVVSARGDRGCFPLTEETDVLIDSQILV
jgi:hypothetical protein